LVREKVEVIVCPEAVLRAAAEATRTIPIVVTVSGDLVAEGWAKSLRRPGGNITGLSTLAEGSVGKQLELLRETVPVLSRVAIVGVAGNPEHADQMRQAKKAASVLGLDASKSRPSGQWSNVMRLTFAWRGAGFARENIQAALCDTTMKI
jgi:putative ABC transport system substrate-binding protein